MLGMHGTYEANLAMHRLRRDDQHRRALRRPGDRQAQRLLAGLEEDPRRHRPVSINKNVRVDVPIVGDCGDVLEAMLQRWKAAPDASPIGKALDAVVDADRRLARRATACATTDSNDASSSRNTRCSGSTRLTQEARHLHHDRGRPAPDVGGPVPQVRAAEPLDDLGRPRHHGLRPAGRDRRADRPSRTRW